MQRRPPAQPTTARRCAFAGPCRHSSAWAASVRQPCRDTGGTTGNSPWWLRERSAPGHREAGAKSMQGEGQDHVNEVIGQAHSHLQRWRTWRSRPGQYATSSCCFPDIPSLSFLCLSLLPGVRNFVCTWARLAGLLGRFMQIPRLACMDGREARD